MVKSMVEERKKKKISGPIEIYSKTYFCLDICKFSGEFKDSVTHFNTC